MTIFTGGPEDNTITITSADGNSTATLDGGTDSLTLDWSDKSAPLNIRFYNSGADGLGTAFVSNVAQVQWSGVDIFNAKAGSGQDLLWANLDPGFKFAYDGGAGIDTAEVIFKNLSTGINFVLNETPGSTSTFIGADSTIRNIERVFITTGSGDDHLTGGALGDYFEAGAGTNSIYAGGGDDNVVTTGKDVLDAGSGHDVWTINHWTGPDPEAPGRTYTVVGGNVTISDGGSGQSVEELYIDGSSGDDTVLVDSSIEKGSFYGNDGTNTFVLDWSDVTEDLSVDLFGVLSVGPSNREFSWGAEDVTILLGTGNDTVALETLPFGTYDGGDGFDYFDLNLYSSGSDGPMVSTFTDGPEPEIVIAGYGTIRNFEQVRLIGGAYDDVLYTGNGNDVLDGDQGDDRLFGGGGDDIVFDSFGNDYLKGGTGADRYVFDRDEYPNLGSNVISGFSSNDLILVQSPLLDGNGDGIIKFGGNRKLNFTNDTGDVTIWHESGQRVTALEFVRTEVIYDLTYYAYGLVGAVHDAPV